MNNSKKLCALCENCQDLKESHIIPAFIFKWIKETSATGYLRSSVKPNLRVQDGKKNDLLCENCEKRFNQYETNFANEIFYPYVSKELSKNQITTNTITYFKYQDWLLRFAISVQWRILITSQIIIDKLATKQSKILKSFISIWRDFLYNKRQDSGKCETHLIFLQNLSTGSGFLPDNINEQVNLYILRHIDGAITTGKNNLGVFVKFGPMCIFTSIIPPKLKNLSNSRIHLKGLMPTIQVLDNPDFNQFLFVDRPNEVLSRMKYSDRQKQIIHETYLKKPQRIEQSLTMRALEADLILRIKKE
jgi:hypothetical protein